MSRIRILFPGLCAWLVTACAAHHDSKANDEPADASENASFADAFECDSFEASSDEAGSDEAGSDEAGSDEAGSDAENADAATGPGVAASPFLGPWTLTGTSSQQCSARSIVAPYRSPVSFEPAPNSEAGSGDVVFDTGLGCSLFLSVEGRVAELASTPALCGTVGTPPDLEFTSLQITAGESSMQITETLSGACSWTIQGTLSR